VAGAAQAVSPATSKPAAEPVANTAPTQLQLDPEDALELPTFLRNFMESFGGLFFTDAELATVVPYLRLTVFGLLIIFFLVVEPEGLNRLWRNIRNYFRVWPFSY